VRLNIKKATLRHWRAEFARSLRLVGVAANATERAVRGETQKAKKDGIYRASLHGDSTYIRAQAEAVATELLTKNVIVESGKRKLLETRLEVVRGWEAAATRLDDHGQRDLCVAVRQFIQQMPPPHTEKENLTQELLRAATKRHTPTR